MRRQLCDNLFLALQPTPSAADRIERTRDEHQAEHCPDGARISRECLHVSLQPIKVFFAGVPDGIFDDVNEIVADVARTTPPFDLSFDRIAKFGGDAHVLWSRGANAALQDLSLRLVAALEESPFPGKRRAKITPHVTLVRGRDPCNERVVEPVEWRVDEFVLIDSLYGLGRHVVFGRWPLRG